MLVFWNKFNKKFRKDTTSLPKRNYSHITQLTDQCFDIHFPNSQEEEEKESTEDFQVSFSIDNIYQLDTIIV